MITRVLVVDDYEPWRRFVCSALHKHPELQIIAEVSDGLEAVKQSQELQPDLILLDIGLPTLNGIEAARRIREVSPASKILFVSDNRSADIAAEALSMGAGGYVVKSDAARELVPAMEAVLQGGRFISTCLAAHDLMGSAGPHRDDVVILPKPQNVGIARRHEVGFYSEDGSFLDGFPGFVATALMGRKVIIFVATEFHRESLLQRMRAQGLDIGAAVEDGRYIPVDAAETISTFMVNGSLDPVRFQKAAGDLIMGAAKAGRLNRECSIHQPDALLHAG